MVTQLPKTLSSNLYEVDYYLWLQSTVELLNKGQLSELDLPNLVEEIESMGRREKSALSSNLQVVLMHLLKYKYQPKKRSHSWKFTIYEHRDRVLEALELSPSLRPYLLQAFEKCYEKARKKASLETGCDLALFPLDCPFTLEEVLDLEYLPDDEEVK